MAIVLGPNLLWTHTEPYVFWNHAKLFLFCFHVNLVHNIHSATNSLLLCPETWQRWWPPCPYRLLASLSPSFSMLTGSSQEVGITICMYCNTIVRLDTMLIFYSSALLPFSMNLDFVGLQAYNFNTCNTFSHLKCEVHIFIFIYSCNFKFHNTKMRTCLRASSISFSFQSCMNMMMTCAAVIFFHSLSVCINPHRNTP